MARCTHTHHTRRRHHPRLRQHHPHFLLFLSTLHGVFGNSNLYFYFLCPATNPRVPLAWFYIIVHTHAFPSTCSYSVCNLYPFVCMYSLTVLRTLLSHWQPIDLRLAAPLFPRTERKKKMKGEGTRWMHWGRILRGTQRKKLLSSCVPE